MLNAEHCITLRTPMKVQVESGSIMAKILYASSIQGHGDTLQVTLSGATEGVSDHAPKLVSKVGVAIPLNNIAGWQTEIKK